MSGLVLDAGALIAIDRDRDIVKKVRAAQLHGDRARTNAMVVAQAWRDGKGRQVTLARALENMDVRSIHEADGRKAGQLLGRASATRSMRP